MAEPRGVRVIDSTLRDGSHAKAHQFTADQVAAIAGGLDRAGVGTVEVSHGDGLGGSSLQYGRSLEPQAKLLEAARQAMPNARLAVLLLPGIGTIGDLEEAAGHGATVARIATHVTEADICQQHIGWAREHGMEAIGFLMMAHMVEPPQLVEQARKMAGYGAQCVYVVDSAGAMTPDDAAGASPPCATRWTPRSRSASTRTTTSARRSATRSRRSPRAPAVWTAAPAGWAPGRATPRPRCWWRRSTSSASTPASTCWGSWTWPRTSSSRSWTAPRRSTGPPWCWATPASTRASCSTPSAPPDGSACPSVTSCWNAGGCAPSAARRT